MKTFGFQRISFMQWERNKSQFLGISLKIQLPGCSDFYSSQLHKRTRLRRVYCWAATNEQGANQESLDLSLEFVVSMN
jgi:hypothetical protein